MGEDLVERLEWAALQQSGSIMASAAQARIEWEAKEEIESLRDQLGSLEVAFGRLQQEADHLTQVKQALKDVLDDFLTTVETTGPEPGLMRIIRLTREAGEGIFDAQPEPTDTDQEPS